MYSEAQKRATMKYRKKNYATITLDVKKELKLLYVALAQDKGYTLTAYVKYLLDRELALSDENTDNEAVKKNSSPEGLPSAESVFIVQDKNGENDISEKGKNLPEKGKDNIDDGRDTFWEEKHDDTIGRNIDYALWFRNYIKNKYMS